MRLAIPCVTGPYTNVGATLTLVNNQVRTKSHQGLKPVPLQRTISIATSRAQNDAGVFELSFHDERNMPFEASAPSAPGSSSYRRPSAHSTTRTGSTTSSPA